MIGEVNTKFSLCTQTPIEKNIVDENIYSTIQKILKAQFTGIKTEIHKKIDRYNFACPYCGDSIVSPWKKRGNLYLDSYAFHCYNCNKHTSFASFANHFGISINSNELIFIENTYKENTQNNKAGSVSYDIFFNNDLIKKYAINKEEFKTKMGFIDVEKHSISTYLKNRLQYNFDNFAWNNKDNQLLIFNQTADNKKIIGLQIRNFKKTPKYLTFDLENIYKLLGKNVPETEDFKYLNKLSNFFGILKIDINKKITAFEGPLDSFLYENSIATCSVNQDFPFDIDFRWFYDKDAAGKNKSIEKINKGQSVFLWKKFLIDADLGINPNQKLDLNKLLVFVKDNGFKIPYLSNYFSENKYDLIWI